MATADTFGSEGLRRLASLDADRADLYGGPNVIVSPKHLMALSRGADFPPTNIAMANNSVNYDTTSSEDSPGIDTPMSTPPMVTSSDFAFAFDIDGVLVRGGQPIPEAVQAMKYINGENPYGVKV